MVVQWGKEWKGGEGVRLKGKKTVPGTAPLEGGTELTQKTGTCSRSSTTAGLMVHD